MISKANRRVAMAACLVLAYKFNEPTFLHEAQPLLTGAPMRPC